MIRKLRILLSLYALSFSILVSGQSSSQNYIRVRTMTNETGTTYKEKVDYYDDLGRLSESVQAKAGGE